MCGIEQSAQAGRRTMWRSARNICTVRAVLKGAACLQCGSHVRGELQPPFTMWLERMRSREGGDAAARGPAPPPGPAITL